MFGKKKIEKKEIDLISIYGTDVPSEIEEMRHSLNGDMFKAREKEAGGNADDAAEREDKIFNNSYTPGATLYSATSSVKRVSSSEDDEYTTMVPQQLTYELNSNKKLEELIDLKYKGSLLIEKYGLKVNKFSVPETIDFFFSCLDDLQKMNYSLIEIFVVACDFASADLKSVFMELPPLYKEEILISLNKSYNVFNHNKVKPLF